MAGKPCLKDIFDALCSDSSADGCDPDWRHSILMRADPRDIDRVKQAFSRGETEGEAAIKLGI